GSYGRPWIFSEVRHYLETGELLPEKPVAERMETMLRHAGLLIADVGEEVAMKEMRHNVIWYVKGLHGAAGYRRECGELNTLAQLTELAERVVSDNS
ncbi:MAG: tRNA-dihydrouridine synthase, partial [Ruminococcus sp.]|nr:tRNA-dihydrouridine synthase [Ruminococcus sp.]